MVKTILFMFCVYLKLSASGSIDCDYGTGGWNIEKNVYYCSVNDDPSITTRELATITSISGNHQSGKTNSNVNAFYVSFKTINYFPRGLETFFKNIKGIQMHSCNLKEIHQEDVKPFSKLVEIYLHDNSLEVLEEGLFDFNPDLEYVYFYNNKIIHIEPKVFDHLTKLRYIYIQLNTCINNYAENSISEVKNVIQTAKSQCINSEFSSLKEKLENLEKDSKTLNFNEKLLTFEKAFNSSKFSSFRPLNYKFEALKNLTIKTKSTSLTCPTIEISPDPNSSSCCQLMDMIQSLQNVTKAELDDLKKSQTDLSVELKGSISDIEAVTNKNARKLNKIEKDLEVTRSKILLSIDSKVKGIEDRLMDRIEELLEEKLAKFVENIGKV